MLEELTWKYRSVITFLVVAFLIFIFLVGTMFPPLWTLLSEPAPQAEITYGEFRFRLEYEINGKVIVIEDIVIVENERTWDAGVGNHNRWPNRLASGNEIIELYRSETEVLFIPILSILAGNLLLGSSNVRDDFSIEMPGVIRITSYEELLSSHQERARDTFFDGSAVQNWAFLRNRRSVEIVDLFNYYNIRLLNFEHDPPIVNSFR